MGQDVLKRYLLSRIALRLLKIIEPYLVDQERMANAQLLRYGSEHLGMHLGQNFLFYCFCLDKFFAQEPVILKRSTPYNLYDVFPFPPFLPETAQ